MTLGCMIQPLPASPTSFFVIFSFYLLCSSFDEHSAAPWLYSAYLHFKIFAPAVPPAQNSPPQISNGQLLLVSQRSQLKCYLLGTLPWSSTRKSPHIQLSSYLSILFTFFLVSTNSVSPSVYVLLSFPESKIHWGGTDSCFCCFPSAG